MKIKIVKDKLCLGNYKKVVLTNGKYQETLWTFHKNSDGQWECHQMPYFWKNLTEVREDAKKYVQSKYGCEVK